MANKYKNSNNNDHSPLLERKYIDHMLKSNKIKEVKESKFHKATLTFNLPFNKSFKLFKR